MKIKETEQKNIGSGKLHEITEKKLVISFKDIIMDKEFGLLHSSHDYFSRSKEVHKIIQTLIYIQECTANELITNAKTKFAGCEKCNLKKFNFYSEKIKKFLNEKKETIHIIRTGKDTSRIFGYIANNCFFVLCIEYKLNTIYKH